MKRKLTLLSVAMMLILAACGGGVKDLANDLATAQKQAQPGGGSTGAGGQGDNAPGLNEEEGYFRAAGQGQTDADTLSFPAQSAMTFEMKPEMLSYDITDLVIQIYDIVLEYSGKYTAAEIMEQFESSVVEFEVDKDAYVPEKWIGAGKWEYIRMLPKHEEKACIVLKCDNPTNDLLE
ncbi:MAG: hypothetical protein IK016_09405 [Lachnospiraceae bacterium]|nr:hypothetical protein [Lachnospiraceae bacterium]